MILVISNLIKKLDYQGWDFKIDQFNASAKQFSLSQELPKIYRSHHSPSGGYFTTYINAVYAKDKILPQKVNFLQPLNKLGQKTYMTEEKF